MTAYRFVTLTCDSCGEIWDGGTDRTARQARFGARSVGWTQPERSQDRCGVCNGTHRRGDYGDYPSTERSTP